MLISMDLMQHIQRAITNSGSPAQLCVMRVLGSDHEYVFRVRYKDVHLDYPVTVPVLSTANKVAQVVNFDEIIKALIVMSKMVVPPLENGHYDSNWNHTPQPMIMSPTPAGYFYEMSSEFAKVL